MSSPLSNLRDELSTVLTEAGIKCLQWNTAKIVPPVAIVVPHPEYIVPGDGDTFGSVNVGFQITLISSFKNTSAAEEALDDLIFKAYQALNQEVDVTNVSAPQEVTIGSVQYFGCVINIEIKINLEEGKN